MYLRGCASQRVCVACLSKPEPAFVLISCQSSPPAVALILTQLMPWLFPTTLTPHMTPHCCHGPFLLSTPPAFPLLTAHSMTSSALPSTPLMLPGMLASFAADALSSASAPAAPNSAAWSSGKHEPHEEQVHGPPSLASCKGRVGKGRVG